jgi:hypothetical protein
MSESNATRKISVTDLHGISKNFTFTMSSNDVSVTDAMAYIDAMMGDEVFDLVNGNVYFFKVSDDTFILAKMVRIIKPHSMSLPCECNLVVQRARSHVGETKIEQELPWNTKAFEYRGKQPRSK